MRARTASKRTLRWGAVVLAFVFACMPITVLAQCEAPYLDINNAIEQRLMPNLRGCTWEEGQKFVRRLNKEATPVEGHSELEVGVVYGQSPDAGTQVTPEMDVVLNVSIGPEPTPPPQDPEPQQPPPPPPPPQGTDLAVTATPGGSGVAVGTPDTFEFVVRNSGPSDAIFTIVFRSTNFTFDAASRNACQGDDHSTTCRTRLESGKGMAFPILGSPEVEGDYRVDASLRVENTPDTNSENNAAAAEPRQTLTVVPTEEPPPQEPPTQEQPPQEQPPQEQPPQEQPPQEQPRQEQPRQEQPRQEQPPQEQPPQEQPPQDGPADASDAAVPAASPSDNVPGVAEPVDDAWPPWVWIAICVGVLILAWIAKVIIWPPEPPVPIPPIVPHVRVAPIRADIDNAAPTSDIPLTAPPLRINVVLAYGDALVHGVLPVTKMEP